MGEAGDLAAGGNAADAHCCQFGNAELLERSGGKGVDGSGDGGEDLGEFGLAGGDRDIEKVGARRLEGLQAADGFLEVIGAVHHPIGAGAEDEGAVQGAGGGDTGADALDGKVEGIGRAAGDHPGVFHADPRKTRLAREADGFGHIVGTVAEAVLEIAGDGEVGGGDQVFGMGQGFVAGHAAKVRAAQGEGMRGGGCREGLGTEGGHHPRGAPVPGIGDDEAAPLVQVVKGLVTLGKDHARILSDFGS
jgi:hypothetical protein